MSSSLPWIALLVPPYLLYASFSGYGVLSISITSLALIVSTIAFTFSIQKHSIPKESFQEEEAPLNSELEDVLRDQQPQNANSGQVKDVLTDQKEVEVHGVAQIHDLYSESESLGSSEDSDIEWSFTGQSPLCSDGSISDEESLIEIALPSGHFVSSEKVFTESIFQQNCLMDFLADMSDVYEEDNFIEIDISMGSIKCSGFEIPA